MLRIKESAMDRIIEKIANNKLFCGMSKEDIMSIMSCSNAFVQIYGDDQIIFRKDDIVNNLGIVVEGELNLITHKYNGTRVRITSLEVNDLFGEALIFSSAKKSPYDLVSSGESKVLIIPHDFIINPCSKSCGFHRRLINNMLIILSDKIVMLNSKMHILNAESIKAKISLYLISIMEKTGSSTFNMPMNRQELAEFFNIKRPSLSREFSNMQRDKIIEVYQSSVKILNEEKLYELSE
jgi:CRP-like cAMP-binding protein